MTPGFRNQSLRSVAGPLWVENILRTSLTTVDVFMLSFFSEKAIAAVGLVNQFSFFIQIMYLMVASGASILLSQYVGAGRKDDARAVALASLMLGGGFSLVLSATMSLSAGLIIGTYSLEPQVAVYATQFLTIFAAGSVFMAFSMLQGTILRTHGRSRAVMVVNMGANVLNILGNSLALFGPFGLPVLGVQGVAASTVVSQLLACIVLGILVHRDPATRLDLSQVTKVPTRIFRQILAIGIPTAGENLSYNLAQMVNLRFITGFGTASMAAYVYIQSLERYVFINTLSLGAATQIKVGWWVGAGETETAAMRALRYAFAGLGIAMAAVLVLNLIQGLVFPLLTKTPEVLATISVLLLISFVMEAGRTFNVILIPALKGAGDVNFPVLVGIASMWGVGVFGGWTLGIGLGWGLVGVWAAVACDELLRGVVMLLRWRSGRWKGKSFVNAPEAVELKSVTPGGQEE
ncbi:MAG: MATE family efflux transporter [Spirochaetales bacterium]